MSDPLAAAAKLAKKEKKTQKGRRGYSDELKAAIREASNEETPGAIAKATGISYQTIRKFVGSKRRAKTAARSRKTTRRKKRASGTNNTRVTVEINVSLPSGTQLRYSDLAALRQDARVLSDAAEQLTP